MEDEAELARSKYRFGLARKHSALVAMHRVLDQMYVADNDVPGVASSSLDTVNELPPDRLNSDFNPLQASPSFQSATEHKRTDSMKRREADLLKFVAGTLTGNGLSSTAPLPLTEENDDEEDTDRFDMHAVDIKRFPSLVHSVRHGKAHSRTLSAFSASGAMQFPYPLPTAGSQTSMLTAASSLNSLDSVDSPTVRANSPTPPADREGSRSSSPVNVGSPALGPGSIDLGVLSSASSTFVLSPANMSQVYAHGQSRAAAYSYEPLGVDHRFSFLLRRTLCTTLCRIVAPFAPLAPNTPPLTPSASDAPSQAVCNRSFSAMLMFFRTIYTRFARFFKNEVRVHSLIIVRCAFLS